MNKLVLLLMWCILPLSSSLLACHETTVSQISATFNNDGSVTYDLDVCIGSEDTWGSYHLYPTEVLSTWVLRLLPTPLHQLASLQL